MEPGHNIALIDHRSTVNGSQFSDFQSQVDTGFDGAFLDDDFMSAISSLKGEWTCADTSAFGIGFPTSNSGNRRSCTDMANAHPQVYNERYKFVKFLKENRFTLAEDLRKKALGGFFFWKTTTPGPTDPISLSLLV
jgi:hypothetical protein